MSILKNVGKYVVIKWIKIVKVFKLGYFLLSSLKIGIIFWNRSLGFVL